MRSFRYHANGNKRFRPLAKSDVVLPSVPKSLLHPPAQIPEFLVSEAIHDVIVYHADGLHERITYGWANELESSFLQISAHCLGHRSGGRNISQFFPGVLERSPVNELPDEKVKPSELFLYPEKGSGIGDRRLDFEPVSYDLGIGKQSGNVFLGVPRDFLGIEIVKSLSIAFSLPENRGPAQSCLRALQNQKLEKVSVIVNGRAPFLVVIGLLQFAPTGPLTTFHKLSSIKRVFDAGETLVAPGRLWRCRRQVNLATRRSWRRAFSAELVNVGIHGCPVFAHHCGQDALIAFTLKLIQARTLGHSLLLESALLG